MRIKAKGYSIHPDTGIATELGDYEVFVTSESSHKTTRRPKPESLRESVTPLIADRMLTKYSNTSYNAGPGSGTVVGPASMFDTVPWVRIPDRPSFTKLHIKLRNDSKDEVMNLAQNLAEYRQTSSMFVSLAQDVYKTWRQIRRIGGIPRGRDSLSKRAANRWLEYQYGLKPLMSDLYNAFERMSEVIPRPVYRRIKANSALTRTDVQYESAPGVIYRHRVSNMSLRSRMTAVIQHNTIRRAAEYGMVNPLMLAWEVIPYSFVVDWLIPVGDIISSLDAEVGLLYVLYENGWKLDESQISVVYGGGRGTYRYELVERFQGYEFNLGSAFSYSPSTSFTAVLNGLALLRQLR